MKENKQTNK